MKFYINLLDDFNYQRIIYKDKFDYIIYVTFGISKNSLRFNEIPIYKIHTTEHYFECNHYFTFNDKELSFKCFKNKSFIDFLSRLSNEHIRKFFPITSNIVKVTVIK